MKTRIVLFTTAVAGVSMVASSPAASISFEAPTAITTADATLNLPGTVLGAATFGGSNATITVTTGNTVGTSQVINFTEDGTVATSIQQAGQTAQAGPPDTGNTNFNSVLNNFAYDGNPTIIQLQGLTLGDTYQVQLFALDDRAVPGTRTVAFSDGTNQSTKFLQNSNVYVLGTFVAGGTTQNIESVGFGYPGNTGDTGSNFNAVVVRSTPEPATMSLLGLAGVGLLARRRRV